MLTAICRDNEGHLHWKCRKRCRHQVAYVLSLKLTHASLVCAVSYRLANGIAMSVLISRFALHC